MVIRDVLLDIDGTLFNGTNPVSGAAETIIYLQQKGIGLRFISNGTRRGRKSVLDKLCRLRIPVSEEQIITPAVAAIRYLKERGQTTCSLLTTKDLHEDFISEGISITDNAPVIVIGDAGDNITYSSINQVFRQIMDGAQLIALEKDRYWMDGVALSLGAGAFVAAIEYASGVSAILMGKPSRDFFQMALQSMGADPGETMMVGDDISSDIGGAQDLGITGVLVMTGKSTGDTLEKSRIKPNHVIPSVALLPDLINMV